MKTMNSKRIGHWAFLGILLAFPLYGWAGEDDLEQPELTVSAEGQLNVSPDKAVLSFAVETFNCPSAESVWNLPRGF